MLTSSRHQAGRGPSSEIRIRSLMRLNEAVQRIHSILDLDVLLDRVVNEIAWGFGCLEASLLLKEPGADVVRVAAVMGCTQCAKHDSFTIGKDGLVGRVAATGLPRYTPDVTQEPHYIACEENTRSEFDVPLIARGEIIGVFSAQHPEIDGFPAEQRALLEALVSHVAVAIENARLFQREQKEKALRQSQDDEARRIQQALFPQAAPQVPGFSIEGLCVPAGAVGGDYYDFLTLPGPGGHKRYGLVLADVAGKGIAAALLMSATRAIVRALAPDTASPATMLQRVNAALCCDLPSEKYVTMVLAVLDPRDRTFTYASAGHPWPVFVDGGPPQLLKTTMGLPLGISEGPYDECTIELPEDSHVLLYSDGVSEAINAAGEEYGLDRLKEQTARPEFSAKILLDRVCEFSHGPMPDDATVITLKGAA